MQVSGSQLATIGLPGSFPHLFARFFDFVFSTPLTTGELETLRGWLSDDERTLFLSQDVRDQAHGYRSGMVVAMAAPERSDLIRAAVLHDVGKRHANLGAVGRSIASVFIKLRLPLSKRMIAYRDHGTYGAEALSEAGAPYLAITFADFHHRDRPAEIAIEDWNLLQHADRADRSFMSR